MRFCYFPGCGNTSLTVFKAPDDEETRYMWIEFIKDYKIDFNDSSRFSLCEIHFELEDIVNDNTRKTLKKGSIPSLSGVSNLKCYNNMVLQK